MNIEITRTLDGSDTLYLADLDEHYHSTFGAIQESMHVFIHSGFDFCQRTEICILEIGLGTGLNCFLTWMAGRDSGRSVQYFAVEKYPLPTDIVEHLNYGEPYTPSESIIFSSLHTCEWECDVQIANRFMFHKIEADLVNLNFSELPQIDLIYFDAFSPEKQPELWNLSIFETLFSKMRPNGILVTYCAKGYVRRHLQAAGFTVERIPGPPGKREMIRAIKT
ncbi:MAG: tRNA (5-methylaminomethyl-2-thiouridine)(34)-methyltransferase MnmD [Prolixibacteraceae bacterium]